MGKRGQRYNNHHIIGQSLASEYNVFMDENQVTMNMFRHEALHKLFGVLLTPKEQMREMYHIYSSVLSGTAKKLYCELLKLPDEEFYIEGMVRNGKDRKQMR